VTATPSPPRTSPARGCSLSGAMNVASRIGRGVCLRRHPAVALIAAITFRAIGTDGLTI
jgi:hypothetical protein